MLNEKFEAMDLPVNHTLRQSPSVVHVYSGSLVYEQSVHRVSLLSLTYHMCVNVVVRPGCRCDAVGYRDDNLVYTEAISG